MVYGLSMGVAVVLVILVVFMMLLVGLIVKQGEGMESAYECGFDSKYEIRSSFSYRFFLVSILFVIFDVEVTLLLPFPFILISNTSCMLFEMFMSLLVLGVLYEMYWGMLEWV